MTSLQLFAARFRVCKSLIIASAIWLIILMVFYYSLDPENVEIIAQQRVAKNRVARVVELTVDVTTKQVEELLSVNDNTRPSDVLKIKKKKVSQKTVTPVPPEILQELGLEFPGENGIAVDLKNVSNHIQKRIDRGWKRHEFNEFASDLISVKRTLPDPREEYCMQENLYLENLPATSVIIIFHNEAWSTLLRSVHSVLDRSPDHLIEEVLLVDDFSNMDHLKEPLDDYMANYPKVKILRAEKREGLIKARIRGTMAAKAPTLTFLDSHIECTTGWLEPLLDRIARDPTKVSTPVIDVIEDETLEFSHQDSKSLQVGGFDWMLTFDWHLVPEHELERQNNTAEPVKSPTMAGGLFSIDKAFFMKLGTYDPDFDIWGAENLELSFKTWMCGGTLEICPCSHVGHIFRKKSPYKWRPGVDVLRRNTIRLVEVWLDEYAKFYYMRTGYDKGDFGDISARVKLRNDLGCKSFKWYLETIYPEMEVPDNLAEGFVNNAALAEKSMCLDTSVSESDEKGNVEMYPCHFTGGNQFFEFTKNLEIRMTRHCLDYTEDTDTLQMYQCHRASGNQEWIFNFTSSQIMKRDRMKCLTVKLPNVIVMQTCNETSLNQKWIFKYMYKEKLAELK